MTETHLPASEMLARCRATPAPRFTVEKRPYTSAGTPAVLQWCVVRMDDGKMVNRLKTQEEAEKVAYHTHRHPKSRHSGEGA